MAYLQNNNDENNQQQGTQGTQMQSLSTGISSPIQNTGGGGAAQPTVPNQNYGNPKEQKGSGRFNNLQKYVQANQGAGERLTSGVQNQINRAVKPTTTNAQNAQTVGQQNIQTGQNTLATGNQLNQTMSADTFTPDAAINFSNNAQNVQDVANFRTGNAINNQDLLNQNQNFVTANQLAQTAVQQQANQIGSELGRIGLLKQAFGGKNRSDYTTGASRLDNLILQSNGQNIQNLQNDVQGKLTGISDLQKSAENQGKTLQDLFNQENDLSTAINNTTQSNIDKFKTGLGNQVEGFNQNLQKNIDTGEQYLDRYTMNDADYKAKYGEDKSAFTDASKYFQNFGLQNGQQTFNVFNNPDLQLNSIADVENRRAQDWRDVATDQNVNQYDALAKLRGVEQPQYELNKASDINTAGYNLYDTSNANSLQGRIEGAKNDFLKNAANQLVAGGTGYVEGVKGAGYISLADYLRNPDYWKNAQVVTTEGGGNLDALRTLGNMYTGVQANLYAPGSTAVDLRGVTDLTNIGQNTINNALGSGLGGLANNYLGLSALGGISNSLFGNSSGNDTGKGIQYVIGRTIGGGIYGPQTQEGFEGAATGGALQDYLNSIGFNNYITDNGVANSGSNIRDAAQEFGYRLNAQGTDTKEGFYNPLAERSAVLQAAQNGPLTREQIAQMSTTSGQSNLAKTRQDLINSNQYLTSDQELNEIINKENAARDSSVNKSATDYLTDLYKGTSDYNNALNQAKYNDQIESMRRDSIGNIGINAANVAANAATNAQKYAQGSGFASSDLGQQYQNYLNQLNSDQNAAAQQRIASQVYGRSPVIGENNSQIAGASTPLTLNEILARMGRT